MIAAPPPTESDLWLTFRYQDALPLATLLPIPHSASPKSKLSLISSGRNEATSVEARASRPIAVLPLIVTGSPLPPVPLPKQVAWGLDLTEGVAVATGFSASTLPPLPTTRSWALKPLADAPAARARVRVRASAQTAASRNGVILGIYATLSSRVELAGPGTGLLASGIREDAPSRGLCVASSGWRARRPRTPPPGHSGGTPPDLHRTSLDHRPICTRRVYPAPTFLSFPVTYDGQSQKRRRNPDVGRRRQRMSAAEPAPPQPRPPHPLAARPPPPPTAEARWPGGAAGGGRPRHPRRALRRRPGGDHHLFDPRRPLWLPAALGPGALDRGADRLPRGRRAARRRHRQGAADPGPRALRRARRRRGDGGAADRQHGDDVRRVRRGGGRDGPADRRQPLRQRAAGGGRDRRPGPARELPPGRAPAAPAELGLRRLRGGGDPRPPRLGRGRARACRAEHPAQPGRGAGGGGDGGDDARALGAGLHPVL